MSRRQLGGSGCVRWDHDCHRSSGDCAAVATGQIIPSSRALLQWEAIVDDPIGALAAVLAYEVIVVSVAASTGGAAAVQLIIGLVVSIAAGVAGGYGIAQALRRGWVPEYMKVPVLFCFNLCFCRLKCVLVRKRTIGRHHHGRLDCECKSALL